MTPPTATRRRASLSSAAIGALAVTGLAILTGCGPGVSTSSASPATAPASSLAAAGSGSPSPSLGRSPMPAPATASAAVFPSELPGLHDWTVITPQAVEIAVEGGTIRLTLTRRALWFQNQRGVLVGQPIDGAFAVSATVTATTRSGAPLTPLASHQVELGGLMARADNAVRENSVFVVVGSDLDGLSVETKSTRDGRSRFDGPAWPVPVADLRLCRQGSSFSAWKRAAGSEEPWTRAATWDRPDLPPTLLVGPNIYSDGTPDLVITVAGLAIRTGSDAACGA